MLDSALAASAGGTGGSWSYMVNIYRVIWSSRPNWSTICDRGFVVAACRLAWQSGRIGRCRAKKRRRQECPWWRRWRRHRWLLTRENPEACPQLLLVCCLLAITNKKRTCRPRGSTEGLLEKVFSACMPCWHSELWRIVDIDLVWIHVLFFNSLSNSLK